MSIPNYDEFLASKLALASTVGREIQDGDIHPSLFEFQRRLVGWAARKGRAALFADTGLGKTFMQLEWARLLNERTLIVAPLTVARQTVREAEKIGIEVHATRSGEDLAQGINITNYEMVEHFDAQKFGAVVLDESSILKGLTGVYRQRLTEMFARTPYRLCCTATPAPNDIAEIANHAEFLGVMTRADMLACFFVHDDEGWRLKKHAHDAFYRWLASWGMSIRRPSDLGFSDEGYELPPLSTQPLWVESDYRPESMLFSVGLRGIQDRLAARRSNISERVAATAALVMEVGGQWIVVAGLNDEADALAAAIPGSVNVQGSDSTDHKIKGIEAFQDGTVPFLVSKVKIIGFGLNLQNCHQIVFCGLNDSWEGFYQMVRRCYRFGQQHPVDVRVVLSRAEEEVWENILRKEREAAALSEKLIFHVRMFEKAEIYQAQQRLDYSPQVAMQVPPWVQQEQEALV